MTMDAFAAMCSELASFSSRLKKIEILSEFLKPLPDADFARVVRFLSLGPVEPEGGRKLSIGYSLLREAALRVTGWDIDTFRACHQVVGDTGETIAALLVDGSEREEMPIAKADEIFQTLAKARRTEAKVELMMEVYRRYRPETLKYFLKIITGSFRVGLQEKIAEEAIAKACGVPVEQVREANNRSGHLPKVALAARHGGLEAIEARLFHAMDFMLAKPLDGWDDLGDVGAWVVEDKFDGIRSQLHVEHGEVRIFSRGMEDVTGSYPEIVTAAQFLGHTAVLDGELLAWQDGVALSFNVLQQRLARKRLSAELLQSVPVIFMAYDLLLLDGEMQVGEIFAARRQRLEALMGGVESPLLLSEVRRPSSYEEIDRWFDEARARGNEGLVLKRSEGVYEAGRRSGTWMKLKRPYGTLDLVITAAEQGHGKRASVLSDYTFAVRTEAGFANVGKAYSGLTDVEIRELTKILKSITTDRFSRVLLVEPQIVLEVAFDGIQRSPRHKSGYALRFPRIVRWRQDKQAHEVDSVDTVRAMYEASLQRGAGPA